MNCRICHKSEGKLIEFKSGRSYWACDYCAFIGLDPKYFLNADKEKARYDLHQNSIEDSAYVQILEKFIEEAISPYDPSEVLDYGSGPEPVLAQLLKSRSYQVENYDPFYTDIDLTGRSFDLISSIEVFEHFYDPLKDIKKILALLKPAGYLSVMTRFSPQLDEFESWSYKNDTTHVSFYSLKTFEYLAAQFNLEILKHNDRDTIVFGYNLASAN